MVFFLATSCSANFDELNFSQKFEYSDYVGIIRINEKISIYSDDDYSFNKIDYSFTEIISYMGNSNHRSRLVFVHSDYKKDWGSYCNYEENTYFDECYESSTENYILTNNYYIVLGFYDEDSDDAIGVRLIELLNDFDETKTFNEQEKTVQDIISRYTTVIDSLESTTTEVL